MYFPASLTWAMRIFPPGDRAMKDNLGLAIFAILAAVLGLSLGDAVVKAISSNVPVWQIYVMRSAIALPVLAIFIKATRPRLSFRPQTPGWTALRSLMLALMWVAYYSALPHIQLSVAAASYYTAPLFITLFASPMAGEKVGRQGWLAVGLGFIGVLVMLRPDAAQFNAFALLPIIAAIFYALSMILTGTKCKAESPYVLSFGLIVAFAIVGGVASALIYLVDPGPDAIAINPFLFAQWAPMGGGEWLAFAVMAAAIIAGSLGAAIAYQAAAASTVATFDYAYVAFSVMWGVVFFAEYPEPLTLLGMSLIAVAGLIAIKR
jgi:drug/metabolite transporter (DMT)-like permease